MSTGYWNGGEAAGWFSGLRAYFWGLRLHLICWVNPRRLESSEGDVGNTRPALKASGLRLTHECARMGAAKDRRPEQ
jgi:hypothetical protein